MVKGRSVEQQLKKIKAIYLWFKKFSSDTDNLKSTGGKIQTRTGSAREAAAAPDRQRLRRPGPRQGNLR